MTTISSKQSLINARLGMIARLSFEQGRANTLNPVPGPNRSSLVSNNAGSAIDTTGGNLISNNGGGLVSNNSGAYRLAALEHTISTTPAADETLIARRLWDTGEQTLRFRKSNPAALSEQRVVEINSDGSRIARFLYKVVSRHA